MSEFHQIKYIDIFLKTVESGPDYNGEISKLNILNTKPDDLHKINSNHIAMFKTIYENNNAILIFFCLPINSKKETSTSKSVAERVMAIIKDIEICFTYLDYYVSQTDAGAFVYLKMVKKYTDPFINSLKEKQSEVTVKTLKEKQSEVINKTSKEKQEVK